MLGKVGSWENRGLEAEKHEWSELTRRYDWDLYEARTTSLEVFSRSLRDLGWVSFLPETQSLYLCTEKVVWMTSKQPPKGTSAVSFFLTL